jgi:hypothetical protein
MAGNREKPEDIVLKLRQVEILYGQGNWVSEAVREIDVMCSIPDDHISPRRSALFMARSVLRELRDGEPPC